MYQELSCQPGGAQLCVQQLITWWTLHVAVGVKCRQCKQEDFIQWWLLFVLRASNAAGGLNAYIPAPALTAASNRH